MTLGEAIAYLTLVAWTAGAIAHAWRWGRITEDGLERLEGEAEKD